MNIVVHSCGLYNSLPIPPVIRFFFRTAHHRTVYQTTNLSPTCHILLFCLFSGILFFIASC